MLTVIKLTMVTTLLNSAVCYGCIW